MKTPEDLCHDLMREIAPMPAIHRLDFLHASFIPMLEAVGYDLARDTDSRVSASLFILIAEIDRRLGEICRTIAVPQGAV